jgi:hypothetical protein
MSKKNDETINSQDEIKDDRAPRGIKAMGIILLLIAVLGLGTLGMSVYFLVVSPSYVRNTGTNQQLEFPELATVADADMYQMKPELASGTDATATDASEDDTEAVDE